MGNRVGDKIKVNTFVTWEIKGHWTDSRRISRPE